MLRCDMSEGNHGTLGVSDSHLRPSKIDLDCETGPGSLSSNIAVGRNILPRQSQWKQNGNRGPQLRFGRHPCVPYFFSKYYRGEKIIATMPKVSVSLVFYINAPAILCLSIHSPHSCLCMYSWESLKFELWRHLFRHSEFNWGIVRNC